MKVYQTCSFIQLFHVEQTHHILLGPIVTISHDPSFNYLIHLYCIYTIFTSVITNSNLIHKTKFYIFLVLLKLLSKNNTNGCLATFKMIPYCWVLGYFIKLFYCSKKCLVKKLVLYLKKYIFTCYK